MFIDILVYRMMDMGSDKVLSDIIFFFFKVKSFLQMKLRQ